MTEYFTITSHDLSSIDTAPDTTSSGIVYQDQILMLIDRVSAEIDSIES